MTEVGADTSPGPSARRRRPSAAVTIHDVARAAGVAASTVSRSFTRPERVNSRTREHIRAVAEQLNYRPNPAARALLSGRTETLGLLVPDITNPFFFDLIRGAERQASAAGYTLVLSDTEESPSRESRTVEQLHRAVDGFVLASSRLPADRIRRLAADNVLVLINRRVAGVPSAVADNTDSTRQLVEHLASLGHRRLAYLGGPRPSWSNAQRWEALREAAREKDLSAVRLGPYAPFITGGAAAADAAIGSGATAVIAFNALLAIGVLRRCAERGKRVPEDISIAGYDDIFGADFCSPPLTTVASPIQDVGRAAVDLLLGRLTEHLGRREPDGVTLPCYLRIRDSTGRAPGGEPGDRAG